ncbi:SusC/RagA family TonB-linked outer membrane protein [Mucilaginibacter myungsuensis]|uniref:TonB-dependent receptor n=1 Tax=Mucilaginibacter myungsuensis TaxID=649104 RepID=A0A929L1Q7_9SPHI|nr:TonB-dependent receptor [Mucilaginibacter myungsuensis]MBE9664592.1 TonB-dependent receptor [Mucilaginibacter myungsuensis]MDN3601058.1 TonB-dependent receptor [Mucilaginibacter myungsuensis]
MQLKLKFCLGMALLISIFSQAYAQNGRLTGKVTQSNNGDPLPGASVSVKGTGAGALTDANGVYSLPAQQKGVTIVVSFIGMKTLEKTYDGTATLNFALDESAASKLNEVVVMGYGTQKVTKVSGAISTVRSADIKMLNPVRTEEALQGRASGVTVIQAGSPGAAPTVLVRGIPSYSGSGPAVVIDGSIQSINDLNALNPQDIESINVLKDAATTAIYGIAGGNGVIMVTTKSGRKNGKVELSGNSNFGVQQVIHKVGVLNATEYAAIINEGSVTSGGNVIFPNLSTLGVGTNWQDQVFQNANMQTHNLSATGGSDKMQYFLSAGFVRQGGIVGGTDKSNFNRGNFTANLNFDLTSKLKFIVNATDAILMSQGVQENSFNSVLGNALNFDPTVAVLNNVAGTPGKYGFSTNILSEVFNPLTRLDNTYNTNNGNKLYGKFEMQYEIIKGLKATSRFGYTKYDDVGKGFTPLVFYGPNNVDNTMGADGNAVVGAHNSVNHTKNSNFNYTWENYANYDFKIKEDHTFETVLGFSMRRSSGNGSSAGRQDVPYNSYEFADFSAATGVNTATNTNAQTGSYYRYYSQGISYFGRVNYDYKGRYLASVSARRDGSSNFGTDRKFADFVSGSLGWVVSSEQFFKPGFVEYLKIRGSYGTSGNDQTRPQYFRIATGGPDYGPTANSNGYNFNNVFVSGSTLGSLANPLLGWEEQKQMNVGFDMNFFNDRFTLNADYFEKRVGGLLFPSRLPLIAGTVPSPTANIGSTKTSGFDITLGYREKIGAFNMANNFTFTAAKNVVTATNSDNTARVTGGGYFNGQSQSVTVFEKGYTPGYFYGYKTQGLFQTPAEIASAPTQAGAQPGDIRFVDVNGDGKIDAADQTQIGDPFPNFTLGWNLTLNYKNFDLNVFTYASVGNDAYRAFERNANFNNKFRSVLGRWTGPGTTNDATLPRYSFTDPNSNIRVSDRYVEDASFVKIKNVQLGYTFPASWTKNVFKSIRLYGQVKNAFVFTKYSGFDPEISGGIMDSGVDRGYYPQPRFISAGLDIRL